MSTETETTYRSRWQICDDCEVSITIERDSGVPDEEEWEGRPSSCPVCDAPLWSAWNADEQTVADAYWAKGRAAERMARTDD